MALKITLIDNAVDEINALRCDLELYMDIVNDEYIPESEKYYAIKRCIKQLICSWELLMKYCIQQIDWKQIFSNPNEATIQQLRSGEFKSVSYNQAIKRLATYGISMPFDNLIKLHKFRNQLEHYEIDVSLKEVIIILLAAIDELAKFFGDFVWNDTEEQKTVSRGSIMLYKLTEIKDSLLKLLEKGFFLD